jgi:hypothetical protein
VAKATRHQNLYAQQMWRQQRFFAGFLVAVGIVMTVLLIYQHQLFKFDDAGHIVLVNHGTNLIWLLYVPTGLFLGGAFLLYRRRSHVEPLDDAVKVSTLMSSVRISYDTIRSVKVQQLNTHFQEKRRRMVVGMMKPLIDKPALFIRLRGTEEEIAAIHKQLGSRLMYEDTIAIPVPDADAVAWEISSHLPERLGQNQGGGKRRKRRR